MLGGVDFGSLADPPADFTFQGEKKAPVVDEVLAFAEGGGASGQIDGRGYGADAREKFPRGVAQLARQFQRDVPAERKSGEKNRRAAEPPALANDVQNVRGLSRVIIRKRQIFGSAAAPQIDAMRRIAGSEHRMDHAARVAGVARSFEAVDEDELASRFAIGPLRMYADFDAGLGFVVHRLDGPTLLAFGPRPKISRNGGKMRILEEGLEGAQNNIVVLESRCARMYWTKLFIPTLRQEPAAAQSAAHRLLIRSGYMRGRDYLPLGERTARRVARIARQEMDAIGGQEVMIAGPMRAVAAELRSHRQLPQIWYRISSGRMRAEAFDLSGEAFGKIVKASENILARCGVAPNAAEPEAFSDPEGDLSPEEFHTPDQKSIADVSRFTGLPPAAQMKSLVMIADGEMILALVRGDHQLEEEKLGWFLDARDLRPARSDEIREAFGADAGSLGPVGAKVRVIADSALQGRRNMICGANRDDYHLRNVTPGEDFQAEFHEIRADSSIEIMRRRGGRSLLQVAGETAEIVNLFEGVCEIFLDRVLEAVAGRRRDADGLAWPPEIAPFGAVITPVNFGDGAQRRGAIELHDRAPFDVLLDDRDERPGVKFKDADLIGIPFRITLGKKLADGVVEIRDRVARTSQDVALGEALSFVSERLK